MTIFEHRLNLLKQMMDAIPPDIDKVNSNFVPVLENPDNPIVWMVSEYPYHEGFLDIFGAVDLSKPEWEMVSELIFPYLPDIRDRLNVHIKNVPLYVETGLINFSSSSHYAVERVQKWIDKLPNKEIERRLLKEFKSIFWDIDQLIGELELMGYRNG